MRSGRSASCCRAYSNRNPTSARRSPPSNNNAKRLTDRPRPMHTAARDARSAACSMPPNKRRDAPGPYCHKIGTPRHRLLPRRRRPRIHHQAATPSALWGRCSTHRPGERPQRPDNGPAIGLRRARSARQAGFLRTHRATPLKTSRWALYSATNRPRKHVLPAPLPLTPGAQLRSERRRPLLPRLRPAHPPHAPNSARTP